MRQLATRERSQMFDEETTKQILSTTITSRNTIKNSAKKSFKRAISEKNQRYFPKYRGSTSTRQETILGHSAQPPRQVDASLMTGDPVSRWLTAALMRTTGHRRRGRDRGESAKWSRPSAVACRVKHFSSSDCDWRVHFNQTTEVWANKAIKLAWVGWKRKTWIQKRLQFHQFNISEIGAGVDDISKLLIVTLSTIDFNVRPATEVVGFHVVSAYSFTSRSSLHPHPPLLSTHRYPSINC